VTLLSFHVHDSGDRPVLTVDRHGSLHVDDVRRAAEPLGLDVRLGATALRRLPVRAYGPAVLEAAPC
jgi:hypothetical protein